jgi:hypothetical protein
VEWEIERGAGDKKVVWTFRNFEVFGNNLVAAKVLRQ